MRIDDNRRQTTTVAMDPIGLGQAYFDHAADPFEIHSNPASAAPRSSTRKASQDIDPQALFDYVYFHFVPSPRSIFTGISKISNGHAIQVRNGQIEMLRYWRPQFDQPFGLSVDDAAVELRGLLSDSVNRAMDGSQACGAFLSGGLDSSTVAGLASRLRPGVQTISMGFDAPGYDEVEYARIASRHFGTRSIEYYVTPDDVLASLPEIAAAFPEPFGNSSAAAVYHCARIAREHGIDLLLAGDGGDEIFGGNERYLKQMIFERYRLVPPTIRSLLLEPAVRTASKVTTRFPIGKAASYISQAKIPLPDRLQTYNFLQRHDAAEVFSDGMLARVQVSEPLQLLRDEYATPGSADAINRMLFLDWKFTLHDNDLVKVNEMCRLAGVSVAYPMLDPAIVNFSMRIPSDWKVRRGELRWFYKKAMRGFLPEQIIGKSKHGFGLPFGVWTASHAGLRSLAEDCLGSLGSRGYFRPAFLRDALRMHREIHAKFYGELVWILTVLELWLRAHAPNARL